ncbi:MAG: insulinase family protein [Ruminococcaceae bacterium]|nr:insulinase family protein [Oscillospiraceae bacterium]
MQEKKSITKSGIRLYSLYTPLHSFVLSLYIPAGPLYDGSDNVGMSHLLEHSLFRNINHIMGGTLYRELDRYGLTLSGATYNELIQISVQGSPKHFDKAADILLLALSPLEITLSELNAEKERVKREIREDTYRSSVDAMSQKAVWVGTGLAETITGTVGKISAVTLSKLHKFSEELFCKNNIFFYLTGAFEEKNLSGLVERLDKISLPDGKTRSNTAEKPKRFFKRSPDITVKRDDFCKVKLAFDIDCEKTRKPARDLVYDILFQGDTSEVFLELSEKNGYVYSFDANLDEYRNLGSLSLSFETSAADFEPALRAVWKIFKNITEKVDEEKLSLAKVPYTENSEFILDDAEALNWNKAWESHILGFEYTTLEARKKAYFDVTAKEVCETAKKIFSLSNLTVAAKHRKPETAEKIIKDVFFS